MRRVLSLIAVVLVLLAQRGDAQQITLAWNPSPAGTDEATTPVGYKVYGRPGSDPAQLVGMLPITATTTTLSVSYDTPYEFWLTAYNSAGLEGAVSNSAFGRVDSPTPPPPLVELCGADGYGNGIDDDADGEVDEIPPCIAPPPPPPPSDTTPPTVSLVLDRNGRSANWSAIARASDPSGVVRLVITIDGAKPYECSPPFDVCQTTLKPGKGTSTITATATDAVGLTAQASQTVTN